MDLTVPSHTVAMISDPQSTTAGRPGRCWRAGMTSWDQIVWTRKDLCSMTTPSGWTPPTCWPTTRRSSARSLHGYADKGMPVLSSTTTRTGGGVPGSTSTGVLPAQQSRQLMSGATLWTATAGTTASIATPGRSSSSTRRSTNPPSVMTSSTPATVPGEHSVPLHILNVSVSVI